MERFGPCLQRDSPSHWFFIGNGAITDTAAEFGGYKVRTAIDESGLSGNGVTEGRLQNLFDGFTESLWGQLANLGVQDTRQVQERVETNTGYQWHYYDGKIH